MNKSLVSVLMSCFNGSKYIKYSVNSLLKQTYENWELIFYDNCSTDNSAEIIKSFKDPRIKYHKAVKHTMIGEAKQNALNLASGNYVAFLDVDDIWLKKKIERQIDVFEKVEKDYAAVYTKYLLLDEREKVKKITRVNLYSYPSEYIFDDVMKSFSLGKPIVNNLTTLFKKSDILKLNPSFDKSLHVAADFDLIERLSEKKKIFHLNTYSSIYRIHDNNETKNTKDSQIKEIDIWINKNQNRLKNNKYYKIIKQNNLYEKVKKATLDKNYIYAFKNIFLMRSLKRIILIFIMVIMPKKILDKIINK